MPTRRDKMRTSNVVGLACAVVALLAPLTAVAEHNDLREFRIGMPVSALPQSGYGGFTCAAEPAKTLSGWGDYKACPAGTDGMHAVSFRYDGNPSTEGKTIVAGQPVTLTLLIDDQAEVGGLRIDTDPHARLYLHKKAHLFAIQVRERFGADGWTCRKFEPTATEQPVGGVFFHDHCEKATETRRYLLDRELFRDPAKPLIDFTDATQLTILKPDSAQTAGR
ncbi:hypothetical protein [Rhodopila globiformis]|uniref:Secreted protein n=1 Tax=Rhodopila globiformis TaxID=1071 RepID=A0A2S6NLG0_RHOGL|nr:hypothetical protein [Rhodopila globiformis]PPQ36165.1 hypothetical protein CCS01_05585 [Rhodopila globiformis]